MFGAAFGYLKGLMQAQRKNMERMGEVVVGVDEQQLQHMLTHGTWDHRAVLAQVAQDADRLLGDEQEACLAIDESSFVKKGRHSVGVARQWCGRFGKVENCQVGVFASLGAKEHAALVDAHLYLPKEWIDSPERCQKAGVPESEIVARGKNQLAAEMVQRLRSQGLRFGWVGVDGGYGRDPAFLRELAAQGETFVADVHSTQRIYLEDPQPAVPVSARNRKNARRQSHLKPVRVDAWVQEAPPEAWQRVEVRKSTQGVLSADFLHRRVWLWNGEEEQARCWHLIVRREIASPGEIKYSLSNASEETTPARLAFMQGQRVWIERAFQNAKSESGMADYQARSWMAWHHHMALNAMAMMFMLEERLLQQESLPLLSCGDVEELLKTFLPQKNFTSQEVIRQMEIRHRKRAAAIQSAYDKQASATPQMGSGEM